MSRGERKITDLFQRSSSSSAAAAGPSAAGSLSTATAKTTMAGVGRRSRSRSSSLEEPSASSSTAATEGAASLPTHEGKRTRLDAHAKGEWTALKAEDRRQGQDDTALPKEWSLRDIKPNDVALLMYKTADFRTDTSRRNIAFFDLDGTLIRTKSGNVHPKDGTDWQFWHPSVPKRLRTLLDPATSSNVDAGTDRTEAIILLSNQAGLKQAERREAWQQKVEDIAANICQLAIPLAVLAAVKHGQYRKPCTGMFTYAVRRLNQAKKPENFFYVGDAAGRPQDHSDVDRKLALNLKCTFHTPEEFFHQREPDLSFRLLGFEPAKAIQEAKKQQAVSPEALEPAKDQEIIVLVGPPAAGKSTFAKVHFITPHGYVHINQDTLKSRPACLQRSEEALKNGNSIIIDNTNAEPATRALYVQLSKKYKCHIRAFEWRTSLDQAQHNNIFRSMQKDSDREALPAVAFRSWTSRYKPISAKEGFREVHLVHGLDFQFKSKDEEHEYQQFFV